MNSIDHLFGFDIPETESVSISEYTEMYLDKLDRYEDLSSSLSLSSGISISVCSEDLNGTSWEEIIIRWIKKYFIKIQESFKIIVLATGLRFVSP